MRKVITTSQVSEREIRNKKDACELAIEGIVLLENNGVLPLKEDIRTIALFGSGARRTIKGGTGSGDVNVRDFVTIEQGLENAGYSISTKAWLESYDIFIQEAQQLYDKNVRSISEAESPQTALIYMMSNPFTPPEFRKISKEELEHMKADVAIYVLARNSGEGADRKYVEGEYKLTQGECADLKTISEYYSKTILLLNVGGVIEIEPILAIPEIDAIVNVSQGGSAFGDAVASVLTGDETPSGRLTTTWAKYYEDYPNALEFGDIDEDDAYYKEGIYVGYRYFDTFGIIPRYAFGYGKSYTEFIISTKTLKIEGCKIQLEIEVQNTGVIYSGKEVVQVYVTAPDRKLDKPFQELRCFAKTRKLAPKDKETLSLEFMISDLASYDEQKSAYILEEGTYQIRVGNSSANTNVVALLELGQDVITSKCKKMFGLDVEADKFINENILNNLKKRGIDKVEDSNYLRLKIDTKFIETKTHRYHSNKPEELMDSNNQETISLYDVKEGKATLDLFISQLSTHELILLCVGGARMYFQDFSVIGNVGDTVPGAAGDTTKILFDKYRIPAISTADGPAGIRVNPKYYIKDQKLLKNPAEDPIFGKILPKEAIKVDLTDAVECYQYCTAIPIATMLAQSWNMELIEKAGELIKSELDEMGIDLWLAPGMNIQRNPLGGRNFEYYSEDPYLSGMCAASITNGVQNRSVFGTCIKHFAANNQETNRNYNNSHVSERALREIYLKGFEICIRESNPHSLMTSLNLINGIHASNHKELLKYVLRDEWGYEGFVMTDWGATSAFGVDITTKKYGCSNSVDCIKAGNDLIMPGSQGDEERLIEAVDNRILVKAELQWCARNILRYILHKINK